MLSSQNIARIKLRTWKFKTSRTEFKWFCFI
jgi:hypothetical protein